MLFTTNCDVDIPRRGGIANIADVVIGEIINIIAQCAIHNVDAGAARTGSVPNGWHTCPVDQIGGHLLGIG